MFCFDYLCNYEQDFDIHIQTFEGEPNLKEGTVYSILIIISVSHFLNDMIQSVVPAIYPIIKTKFGLSFAQSASSHWCFKCRHQSCNHSPDFIPTVIRVPMRCQLACASPLLASLSWLLQDIFFYCFWPCAPSDSAPPFSIPKPRGWPSWHLVEERALRKAFSKLAATEVLQSAHFSQQPSYSPSDKKPSVGLPLLQWRPLPSWCALAAGTACACLMPQGNQNK